MLGFRRGRTSPRYSSSERGDPLFSEPLAVISERSVAISSAGHDTDQHRGEAPSMVARVGGGRRRQKTQEIGVAAGQRKQRYLGPRRFPQKRPNPGGEPQQIVDPSHGERGLCRPTN